MTREAGYHLGFSTKDILQSYLDPRECWFMETVMINVMLISTHNTKSQNYLKTQRHLW
jgi:hypothetical protein